MGLLTFSTELSAEEAFKLHFKAMRDKQGVNATNAAVKSTTGSITIDVPECSM
jgi:hypothetical protein